MRPPPYAPEAGGGSEPHCGKRLFGTDGVRGVAGEFPLDARTVYALGVALGEEIRAERARPKVLLGMDTRESSLWIAGQIAGGLARAGVVCRNAGIITTPGLAYLTRQGPFAAGGVISASHNPYRDNGIKVFGHSGYKLPDEQEQRIEQRVFELLAGGFRTAPRAVPPAPELVQRYEDFLAASFPFSLRGLKVALDCAHGAAYALAPRLFQRLGASVIARGCEPDGRNINLDCGALHPEGLRHLVVSEKADLGIAFDGDADRAIFVARDGSVLDGDAILLMTALWLNERGRLRGADGRPTVVATVMSNLGLERALASHGIRMLRTAVGDKYVLEEMLRSGAVLGGEQSGHIIFLNYATTGDGLLTALRVLEIVLESGRDLKDYAAQIALYPQCMLNVRIRQPRPLEELSAVQQAISEAERAFGPEGRVLVRFSGTEPVVRVMVEGPNRELVEAMARRIASVVEAELAS